MIKGNENIFLESDQTTDNFSNHEIAEEDFNEYCHENEYNKDYINENIFVLNKDLLSDITIDPVLFSEGVKEVSKICGKISALCSVGITPSMALSYISDKEISNDTIEYNLAVSKMNADATVESSKYGMSGVQKMMV